MVFSQELLLVSRAHALQQGLLYEYGLSRKALSHVINCYVGMHMVKERILRPRRGRVELCKSIPVACPIAVLAKLVRA